MSTDQTALITIDQSSAIDQGVDLTRAGITADAAARTQVFVDYQQRKAARTVAAQRDDLARFAHYLGEAGVTLSSDALMKDPVAWQGISWGLVKGFVVWQLAQGFAVGSLNRALSTVKQYVALAAYAEVLPPDTARLISTVSGYSAKEARRINNERDASRRGHKKAGVTAISRDQITQLKTPVDDSPVARRDAFLFALLLDHGLRVGEVAALDRAALDLSAGTLRFWREKVHKEQTHSLTRNTFRAALAYFHDRDQTAGPLLVGSTKAGRLTTTRLSVRAINHRVGEIGRRIGVIELSPHDLRHAWATRAMANGTDVAALQDAGGWASPAMPLRYAEASKIANERVKLD